MAKSVEHYLVRFVLDRLVNLIGVRVRVTKRTRGEFVNVYIGDRMTNGDGSSQAPPVSGEEG